MNSDQCLCWSWFIVNLFCQEYDSTLEQSEGCYALADGSVSRGNVDYWWHGVKKGWNQCHPKRRAVDRAPSPCVVQKSLYSYNVAIRTQSILPANDERRLQKAWQIFEVVTVFINEKQHGEIHSLREAELFLFLWIMFVIVGRILYGNYPIAVPCKCSSLLLHYCKYEQTSM